MLPIASALVKSWANCSIAGAALVRIAVNEPELLGAFLEFDESDRVRRFAPRVGGEAPRHTLVVFQIGEIVADLLAVRAELAQRVGEDHGRVVVAGPERVGAHVETGGK